MSPAPHDKPPPMRRRRARILPIAILIAVGFQVPVVWALGRLGGHTLPIVVIAAALTGGFISSFLGPRAVWGAPGHARLYLIIWPFFVWWTIALLFALIAPLAFGTRALLGAGPSGIPRLPTNDVIGAGFVAAVLGAAVALYQRPRVRAREIFIAGLPAAFEGYRIVQISDLHCGPFVSARRVSDWVAAVNDIEPDLVAVTGDFIASGPMFVPAVAGALAGLAARDGVYASMGNHDYFGDGEALAGALESAGLAVLRNRGVEIQRDGSVLYVAGVDDTWSRRHDVGKALAGRPPDAPVVLLAHDPALFPEAAARGVDLTLSGHTHGGQLGLPFFARRFNLARLLTPFTSGLYRKDASTLYVNRGLGTTGPPIRVAVPPEIAVLTLRRAAESPSVAAEPALRASSR